jgi:hypothetical protein
VRRPCALAVPLPLPPRAHRVGQRKVIAMKTNWNRGRVVEVAVVVLILAALAALLLPAVQPAREAARRAGEFAKSEVRSAGEQLALADQLVPRFAQAGKPGDKPAADRAENAAQRKIIYTANIELVVEDFSRMGDQVAELVKRFSGYVADSNVTGASGENRRASWKIRVPVASFDEFVKDAKHLGELVSASTNSQDVSEEYYDVDARIRNKTKEEERLLKLLEDRPGKLEDVIAIERELSRVREELERMQGRMRVLADRTSLTSVQLVISEVHNYQPDEAATIGTRIRRAFSGSLSNMQSAAEQLVVIAAALAPWLAVLAMVLGGAYVFARSHWRAASASKGPIN